MLELAATAATDSAGSANNDGGAGGGTGSSTGASMDDGVNGSTSDEPSGGFAAALWLDVIGEWETRSWLLDFDTTPTRQRKKPNRS